MSFHPKWLIATRHKKKKKKQQQQHGLATCDGSAPHGAMSPSMSSMSIPWEPTVSFIFRGYICQIWSLDIESLEKLDSELWRQQSCLAKKLHLACNSFGYFKYRFFSWRITEKKTEKDFSVFFAFFWIWPPVKGHTSWAMQQNWLFGVYKRDYTTQLCGDHEKNMNKDPYSTTRIQLFKNCQESPQESFFPLKNGENFFGL